MEGTNDAAATGGKVDLHTQIRQLIVGARRTIARGVVAVCFKEACERVWQWIFKAQFRIDAAILC